MFRARIASAIFACAMFCLFAATMVQAATGKKRVALVIGNSAYEHTARLNNPVRDARAMAASLERLGFDVVKGFDLKQSEMRAKIREFTSRIEGADVTLFYYAGHGFQIEGKNQIAPIDARLEHESDVDFETVPLNLVLRQMERERRTNLVFLDACRDNPLASQLARSLQGRSISPSRGLARVESGVGTLIGYATSPGMVAYDGEGEHSPYTQAILNHIETPGLSINDMMIAVRQDVLAESRGKQVPWEHSSLTGQYYFQSAAKTAAIGAQRPPSAASGEDEERAIAAAYQATVAIGSCGAYRIFEERHRTSFYGRLAEEYLRENCSEKKRLIAVEPRQETPAPAEKTEEKLAAVSDADAAAAAGKPDADDAGDAGALTVSIQQELARLGCSPGTPDGDWGPRTRNALSAFNAGAKLDLKTDAPNEKILSALRAKSGAICKRQASPPPPAAVSAPKSNRSARQSPPPAQPAARPAKKSGSREYWGGESTRFDCESRGVLTAECFEKPRSR